MCHSPGLVVGGESCGCNCLGTTWYSDSHHGCPDISLHHCGCNGRLCGGDDIRPRLGDSAGKGGGYILSDHPCLSTCLTHRSDNERRLLSIHCIHGGLCLCSGDSDISTGNSGDSSLCAGNCLCCKPGAGNGDGTSCCLDHGGVYCRHSSQCTGLCRCYNTGYNVGLSASIDDDGRGPVGSTGGWRTGTGRRWKIVVVGTNLILR